MGVDANAIFGLSHEEGRGDLTPADTGQSRFGRRLTAGCARLAVGEGGQAGGLGKLCSPGNGAFGNGYDSLGSR